MATKTTAAAKATARTKKSKAEVQEEFEDINEELFAEKEASNQKITEMERLKDVAIKDSEAERKLAQYKIDSLEKTIEAQKQQIETLDGQLIEAKTRGAQT